MVTFRQGVDDSPSGRPPMIGKCLSAEQWLGYIAAYNFGKLPPDRVVLHHTVVPTLDSWAGLRTMKGMQTFYANKGWNAAPHVYIAPEGIWLFTPLKDVGIHAGTGNGSLRQGWYSIGVEMVGNYDNEKPSGPVWQHTLVVLGSLCRRFGRTPEAAISFHRDFTNEKSCPGWAVTKPWVWSEVNAWLRPPVTGTQRRVWQVRVTAGALNVRQGRGTTFPIAATLKRGDILAVDDDTDAWLHLADERGFIARSHVEVV